MYTLNFMKDKIREYGLLYCIKTGVFKIYPVRLMKSFLLSIDSKTRPTRKRFWTNYDSKKYSANKNHDTLYAFYDLAVAPATFDIIDFLVLAEHLRIQKQCKNLHVVIVPGTEMGFRPRDLKEYQRESIDQKNANVGYMEWRLRNILIPSCWLMPSCKGITVVISRDEGLAFELSFVEHRYPENYSVRYPIAGYVFGDIVILAKQGGIIPSVAAPQQALRFIKEWLKINAGTRKTIVITFRESTYEVDRNGNLIEWGKFVQNLDTSVFCPIIIRDTEKAFELLPPEFEKALIFPEACFNLEVRSALYELCYLNMSVSCGPVELCENNKKTRYIVFKLITRSCGATSKHFFQSQGIEPGTQPDICGPFQKWVWEDDTFEVLQREFYEMCEKIDNNVKT